MIVNVHRLDKDNLGDQVCSPCSYFEELKTVGQIDMDSEWPKGDTLLVGGGGMLHGSWTEKLSQYALTNSMIAWGIGLNNHGTSSFVWPKFLDYFKAVGLRDFGNPWDYVPCVSCMHEAFDECRQMSPRFPVVIYEHLHNPIEVGSGMPRMSNRQPRHFFREAVRFLSFGETVLTNSFHGAYWAMLLGRRVVIYKPFSNRFHSFEGGYICADENDWMGAIESAKPPVDGYLAKCRDLNIQFFNGKVKPLI